VVRTHVRTPGGYPWVTYSLLFVGAVKPLVLHDVLLGVGVANVSVLVVRVAPCVTAVQVEVIGQVALCFLVPVVGFAVSSLVLTTKVSHIESTRLGRVGPVTGQTVSVSAAGVIFTSHTAILA